MYDKKIFSYLDREDKEEFALYWKEYQDILVAGGKSLHRIEKYISEEEFERIRVILSALVHDFKFEKLRSTTAVSLILWTVLFSEDPTISDHTKNVIMSEAGLLKQHLMGDDDELGDEEEPTEKELFEKNLEIVVARWNEYMADPVNFVL